MDHDILIKMETMAISKFKATCLATLERVRRTGRPLRVTRFGKPVADVVPPATPTIAARAEPATADDLAAFGNAAALLRSRTAPGEPVLAFPALTGLLFATQLAS